MLEAFSDLSDFPQLNEISAVRNLYEPLHELESRSVSGNLLTNIFAGGTTNTEWGFLTGYSQHEEFRGPINSYVRYFKDQGYDALYRHPATRGSTTAATSTNTLALTNASSTNRASATSFPSRTRSSSPTPCSSTTS